MHLQFCRSAKIKKKRELAIGLYSKGLVCNAELNYTDLPCLPNHSRHTFHIPNSRSTTQFSKVNHNWCSMVCTRGGVLLLCHGGEDEVQKSAFEKVTNASCKQQMQGTMQIREALPGCRSCLQCKHAMAHGIYRGRASHIACRSQDSSYGRTNVVPYQSRDHWEMFLDFVQANEYTWINI